MINAFFMNYFEYGMGLYSFKKLGQHFRDVYFNREIIKFFPNFP